MLRRERLRQLLELAQVLVPELELELELAQGLAQGLELARLVLELGLAQLVRELELELVPELARLEQSRLERRQSVAQKAVRPVPRKDHLDQQEQLVLAAGLVLGLVVGHL